MALPFRSSPARLMRGCEAFFILGHVLNADATPKPELLARLDMALLASQSNPDATLLVSGGGQVNGVTEADLMKRWLTDRGVSCDRVLLERESRDTVENIVMSTPMLVRERVNTVGLITGVHHMLRAASLLALHLVCTRTQITVRHWASTMPGAEPASPEALAREHFLLSRDRERVLEWGHNRNGVPGSARVAGCPKHFTGVVPS